MGRLNTFIANNSTLKARCIAGFFYVSLVLFLFNQKMVWYGFLYTIDVLTYLITFKINYYDKRK